MAKTPQFCKDVKAVAKVIGLALYDDKLRRRQLSQQLESVKAVTAVDGFPRKQKQGWTAGAVAQFRKEFLTLSKDKRSFSFNQRAADDRHHGSHQGDKSNLPQPHEPGGDAPAGNHDDLFASLSPAEKLNRRLDFLEDKYFHPQQYQHSRITNFEVNELKQHRPHLWAQKPGLANTADAVPMGSAAFPGSSDYIGPGGTPYPSRCSGLKRLCNYIKLRFADYNVKVRPQSIEHWQNGKGVPHGAPFFPVYDEAGRYDLNVCFAWFEKWILPKYRLARSATPEMPGMVEPVPLEDLKESRRRGRW
jgi:hypothetical protein